MPIGVFDSGIGGLTVLQGLTAKLPDQAFIYYGDNARAPYGTRQPQEIVDLTREGVERLFGAGCDLVILACNTASAVALRPLQEYWVPANRRVLGVFVPMIEVVTGRPWADRRPPGVSKLTRVAFFATPATVASGAFPREVALRATGVEITSVGCAGLVDALETGRGDEVTVLVERFAAEALAAIPAPEVAILGCTHYPLAAAAFAAALPEQTRLLGQGRIVADSLADYLTRHPGFAAPGPVRYLTSGDPAAVRASARALLGRDLPFAHI